MNPFIGDDFLLSSESARILYHEYAKNMPIFDYHCHLNPKEIYEDKQFVNLGEAWLATDHYKWRVMRANAVPEKYITGQANYRQKFDYFAATMPNLIGNPIYHWSHLELKRFFGIDFLLCPHTANQVWDCANSKLQSAQGTVRKLIAQRNVRALCTTDDPIDTLQYHRLLAQDDSFGTKVLPTFRPEKVLNITEPGYCTYIQKLGASANLCIHTIEDIKQALSNRIDYFATCGCHLSDHSFGSPDFTVWNPCAAEKAMQKALEGEQLSDYEVAAYQSYLMDFLGETYSNHNWTMQVHIGAVRNLNTKLYLALGTDIGGDAIGDVIPASSLAALLDRMAVRDKLPKTILYTLNAADNDKLIAIAGCFQDESTAGKIQFGSAWWFHDHYDGMTAQIKSLANIGVLSRFIGMLTDSRSFLSYPRHEYFRRILCEVVGNWIERGMAPRDYNGIGQIIEDICFNNVWNYIGLD